MEVPTPPEAFRQMTRSRMPSYRTTDLKSRLLTMDSTLTSDHSPSHGGQHPQIQTPPLPQTPAKLSISPVAVQSPTSPSHVRYHSTGEIATTLENNKLQSPPRPKTFSTADFSTIDPPPFRPSTGNIPAPDSRQKARNPSKVPASNSRRDVEWEGPPPAMITQRSYPFENSATATTTQTWVATQQSPTTDQAISPTVAKSNRSSTDNTPSRPLIQPIRAFKPSSRRSTDMASNRNSTDPDSTIRALEGFELHRSNTNEMEREEPNSDESDLFLRAAREEELAQRNNINDRLIRSDKRRSMISPRTSVPPSSTFFHPSMARRRGSDNEGSTVSRVMDEQESIGQALTYRPSTRERPSALEDINKSRYFGAASRSNPTTPRTMSNRAVSPESQVSAGGRRPSVAEQNHSARGTSYRQSNLSYSTPRSYNSSPLVSRSADVHMPESSETPRVVEGTESTVSTTAPSTVWDELDELKSRIHRLELTGKLPPTSGAAISRASSERPPTATTTVTTISSSPKRGRNNSISPIDSTVPEAPENHPLLHEALIKSKSLLAPEIFKALEAATADALAISQMMGTSGQPGPLSSHSTVGGLPTVSDRQVRRKADSMCRSLTELCLALSEGRTDHPPQSQAIRPGSRDAEVRQSIEPANNQRLGMSTDLMRAKSSPRALSRLEARRSSLLIGSTLPTPRYSVTESNTPTHSSMANRRTSLLLRSSRRGTEEPEEEDEMRFRAPSRAATDIGRIRNSPREYSSQQPLPERLPERLSERTTVQSNLPVRRHYNSGNLTNTPPSMPPVSSLGGRRYLDRSTPERDTNSVASRLVEDRAQRKSSIGFPTRTGSLTRKARQPNSHSADLSAGHSSGYQ